jgi:tRNA dimethylallyltransferase
LKQIAIIAPTASGKTALSISLAHQTNSIILSLDSLAIYKQIDIASAKPTLEERDGIVHFGIDEIYPDEKFDVMKFIEIYKRAKDYAISNNKNLIIVGGTGFYLKAMIDGISYIPTASIGVQNIIDEKLITFSSAELYEYMSRIDEKYMQNIKSNDSYRIEKALSVYLITKQKPSVYFEQNPANPIIKDIQLFEIVWDRELLRKRIELRTNIMFESGLINEVCFLQNIYTRDLSSMKSIGIKEVLEYLDCKITKKEAIKKVAISTAQLAKRQRTFNNGQFKDVIKLPLSKMEKAILKYFNI